MSLSKINFSGIIADVRELLMPLAQYAEYLCIFPQRYMPDLKVTPDDFVDNFTDEMTDDIPSLEEIKSKKKLFTFTISNESTKEKVNLKNVEFNEITEIVTIYQHDTMDQYTITQIVKNIISKLNWIPSEQVIIVSNDKTSFSFGAEYYCVRDISGKFIDICVKDSITNSYVPAISFGSIPKEYEYNKLISN